jgi:hypothetical protein
MSRELASHVIGNPQEHFFTSQHVGHLLDHDMA